MKKEGNEKKREMGKKMKRERKRDFNFKSIINFYLYSFSQNTIFSIQVGICSRMHRNVHITL